MGQASRSLTDFEKGQQKLGGASQTAMGRLVQSAQINEREWSTVGRTLMTAGAAVTGLGVAALKTGVQYNTLQQTTRAALTTIMGSAEGANAQMDKLDDFARNSPFAKQVFIEAQQQMLGFGIEARKVIPYMDAIQNAVAATGGSNQDIAELARVFSTVQANAKITARELMMFGQRGVDAATIIGSQMGKTGAEIREEITAGTLDAGEALDALAAGMDERFGGAAANVKETFAGAWDRVKAAWRDFSADLATPLVDPMGGGLLIDWLNSLADAMRSFMDAPGWVKGAVSGFAGLTGTTALLGGAFMLAVPRIVEFQTSLKTLTNAHPLVGKFAGGLGKVASALGILSAAFIAFGAASAVADKFFDTDYNISGLALDLRKFAGDTDDARVALDSFVDVQGTGLASINSMEQALKTLDYGGFLTFLDEGASLFGVFDSDASLAREGIEGFDQALAELASSGNQEAVNTALEAYLEAARDAGVETDVAMGHLELYNAVLAETELGELAAAEAASELEGSFLGIGTSAEDAQDVMANWSEVLAGASESFGGILEAYDAVIEKQGDTSYSTAETMDQMIEEMQKQAAAHSEWSQNLVLAMEQANTELTGEAQEMHKAFVDEMTEAGIEGAAALQTFVDGTPAQREELVDAWVGTKTDIQEVLDAAEDPRIGIEADTDPAYESVTDILIEFMGMEPAIPVEADTAPAEESFDHWSSLLGNTTTDTNVDADVSPADSSMSQWWSLVDNTTTDTNVDANTTPAEGSVNHLWGIIGDTTTDTNVDANTNPAKHTFGGLTSEVANTQTDTKIGADTSPARSAWDTFKSSIGSLTTRIFANFITPNKYEGGWIGAGLYEGGTVMPGLRAGGRVPGSSPGYDNILWPLHAGGQILSQPLEGGEFVVRSSEARNYPQELNMMNNGTYPRGTLERAYRSSSAGNVTVMAPPVDTAAIGAAVSAAIRSHRPVVQIGGREFYGVMQETTQQYGKRF